MSVAPLVDPERTLALAYVPAARRPAVHALWALDEALAAIVAHAREPALAQIRLAWWREALLALGGRGPPPVDPLLRALDAAVVPLLDPATLAPLAEGWGALLGEPDADALAAHARERGATLFRLSAALLGVPDFVYVQRAGRLWSLVDASRRPDLAVSALALAREQLGVGSGQRWPKMLRPLGMLATLAAHDARAGAISAGPARLARMIAHRLTGRAGLGGATGGS